MNLLYPISTHGHPLHGRRIRFPLIDDRGANITLVYDWATGESWASCALRWPDSILTSDTWRSGWI